MTASEIDRLLSRHAPNATTLANLQCCVGRILRRNEARGIPDRIEEDELRHLVDWLEAARLASAFWLTRTDAEGRPLKLMKLGSIAACMAEADKAMRLEGARSATTTLGPDDEAVEWDLGGGWSMVRLLTPAALDLEGSRMGHCIGGGSYDSRLLRTDHCFLSLRGPGGRPHATVHMTCARLGRPKVVDAKGKRNARPIPAYRVRICDFLRAYDVVAPSMLTSGLVHDASGYRLAGPGDTIDTSETVHLEGAETGILAPGMRFAKGLHIEGSDIAALPEGVAISGFLLVKDCGRFDDAGASEIPPVDQVLIHGCPITRFVSHPSTTVVSLRGTRQGGGEPVLETVVVRHGWSKFCYVDVREAGSVEFSSISGAKNGPGPSCRVDHFVDLENCRDVGLPSSLKARTLRLGGSSVSRWPDDLQLRDRLAMKATGSAALPAMTRSPQFVDVARETVMTDMQGDFARTTVVVRDSAVETVESSSGRIGGLFVTNCPLRRLQDGLHVKGDLDLSGVDLERLPDGLRVDGSLKLVRVPIRRLPDDLRVGVSVHIVDCPIEDYPSRARIGRHVAIVRGALAEIPDATRIRGSADFGDNPLVRVGRNLRIGGSLDLRNTLVDRMPADIVVGGVVHLGPRMPTTVDDSGKIDLGVESAEFQRKRDAILVGSRLLDLGLVSRPLFTRSAIRNDGADAPENGPTCRGVVRADGISHPVRSLPDDRLSVQGNLVLSFETPRLPAAFEVAGDLSLTGCDPIRLPEKLRVGGGLSVDGRGSRRGEDLTASPTIHPAGGSMEVGGDAAFHDFHDMPTLASIRVGGDMKVVGPFFAMPDELVVRGSLEIDAEHLRRFEGRLEVRGDLVVSSSSQRLRLPPDVVVGGRVRHVRRADERVFLAIASMRRMLRGTTESFRRRRTARPNFIETLCPGGRG